MFFDQFPCCFLYISYAADEYIIFVNYFLTSFALKSSAPLYQSQKALRSPVFAYLWSSHARVIIFNTAIPITPLLQ